MKFYRTDPTGAVFTDCPFRQGIVMWKRTQQPSWVAAVFQNAAVSINVARQTTFAQLAEKLTVLADIHGQLVQPVHISIATALFGTSVYQSSCSAGD